MKEFCLQIAGVKPKRLERAQLVEHDQGKEHAKSRKSKTACWDVLRIELRTSVIEGEGVILSIGFH